MEVKQQQPVAAQTDADGVDIFKFEIAAVSVEKVLTWKDLDADESAEGRYQERDPGDQRCIRSPKEIEGEVSQA